MVSNQLSFTIKTMNDKELIKAKNKFLLLLVILLVSLFVVGYFVALEEKDSHRLAKIATRVAAFVEEANKPNSKLPAQIININTTESKVNVTTNIVNGGTKPAPTVVTTPKTVIYYQPAPKVTVSQEQSDFDKEFEAAKKRIEDSRKEFCKDNPEANICD